MNREETDKWQRGENITNMTNGWLYIPFEREFNNNKYTFVAKQN
jgi:hypothetical protein